MSEQKLLELLQICHIRRYHKICVPSICVLNYSTAIRRTSYLNQVILPWLVAGHPFICVTSGQNQLVPRGGPMTFDYKPNTWSPPSINPLVRVISGQYCGILHMFTCNDNYINFWFLILIINTPSHTYTFHYLASRAGSLLRWPSGSVPQANEWSVVGQLIWVLLFGAVITGVYRCSWCLARHRFKRYSPNFNFSKKIQSDQINGKYHPNLFLNSNNYYSRFPILFFLYDLIFFHPKSNTI